MKWKCPDCFWTTKTTHLVNSWLLFSLLSKSEQRAGCMLGGNNPVSVQPTFFQCHLFLHGPLMGAHTAPQQGRRASGALERLQTGAGSSCHQSSEAGLQHKPLGQSEVGAVSYFGSGHPFPAILFPRISPLAVTSLSVQHSRVVVGSRNRAVLWHWEVMLGSLLLPVGWAVCWPSTCPGFTYGNKSLKDVVSGLSYRKIKVVLFQAIF